MNKVTDETKISLIGKDIEYIRKDIIEIKETVKSLAGVYATQISVDSLKAELVERLDRLERSSNLWKWLSPTLSAVFSAGATFLFISYLQNIK